MHDWCAFSRPTKQGLDIAASKRASKQASERASKQASEQASSNNGLQPNSNLIHLGAFTEVLSQGDGGQSGC